MVGKLRVITIFFSRELICKKFERGQKNLTFLGIANYISFYWGMPGVYLLMLSV